MSHEIRRRGRNWYTAMGVLFIVMALIVFVRNIFLFQGPEFILDFLLNSDITNEKISLGMLVFGGIMIILGFRKKIVKE